MSRVSIAAVGDYPIQGIWSPYLEDNFQLDKIIHADPAIKTLTQKPYPLILIDPHIAPGLEYDDPKIRAIMRAPRGGPNPNYFAIGLRVIERVRASDSVNRDTPILVATTYDPVVAGLFPGAKAAAQNAGATEYLCVFDHGMQSLTAVVERLLASQVRR